MADTAGDGVVLQECAGCRARRFPERLRCPTCGGREFRQVRVTSGCVREVTARPDAAQAIATVGAGGATLIARVPATARPGDEIRLTHDPCDAGAAFVPPAVAGV